MINEKGNKNINNIFSTEKEVPILKHFYEPKSPVSKSNKAFLYSEPPEVILQSKKHK